MPDPRPQFPPARSEVEQLQSYSAPLEGRRGLLRLDFNENSVGPSPKVVEAIRGIPAEHYAIYPEYDGLREAFSQSLGGLPCEQIGLFNGVDAALHAICQAYGNPGDVMLTTSPTFGYYQPCARMQGMVVNAIPYEGDDYRFPLQDMQRALAQLNPRLLLLCNPNNPTGTRLEAEAICQLAAAAPSTLVVVDELYEAFTGDSVLPQADFSATPNLLVLRSLSKTAGIAGLRLGIAVGSAAVVDRISRVTGPYDINSFAVIAGMAALQDQAYVDDYVKEVLKAKAWLVNKLNKHQVRHHSAGGNYLLIWPSQGAASCEAALRQDGILVRSMAGKALIDGSLRVSIGTSKQMKRFWKAFSAQQGLG